MLLPVLSGGRQPVNPVLIRYAGCVQMVLTTVKVNGMGISEDEIYLNNSAPASIDLLHTSVTFSDIKCIFIQLRG